MQMSFVFWSFKFMICLGFSVLYLFWAITSSAIAQGQAGTDIAILNAGVGARALGMGSAFTAIADNADAPYWNPAGLGQVTSNEITTMQTRLSTDADHYYISYVRPALGGTLGISWIQVGLGSINQTSAEVDINNEVQNLSIFSYFSNAYLLSYGKNLNEHISIGLKLDDALNQQQWGTGTIEKVPPKLRLGLAYHSPNPGTFAVDVSQTMKSNYSPDISAGYEWTDKFLSFRVGYAGSGLTAGAGFAINQARVDYAFVNNRELSSSNVHRISLSGVW